MKKSRIDKKLSILKEKYGEHADIFTIDEFADMVDNGSLIPYDGYGYFIRDMKITDMNVWDNNLTWDKVKKCQFVIWYNR